jgi:diketogulonate reductase-like aldo/keto reductase
MGRALRDGYRQKAFLMTKIDGRNKTTAATQINESLRRLQTDRIDLLQFHEVIRDSAPDRIFAEGGAMEAVLEARKAGKVRFIGFTGHKSPDIHLKMLATASKHGFTFDAVQMPLNVMDAHFDSFEKKVLPVLTKDGVGVLGMKPMGDHFILPEQNGYIGRVSLLPDESSKQRGHYRLRFAPNPSAGSTRRPQFPADGLFPSRGSSRKDGKGCGSRPVRTLQNESPL